MLNIFLLSSIYVAFTSPPGLLKHLKKWARIWTKTFWHVMSYGGTKKLKMKPRYTAPLQPKYQGVQSDTQRAYVRDSTNSLSAWACYSSRPFTTFPRHFLVKCRNIRYATWNFRRGSWGGGGWREDGGGWHVFYSYIQIYRIFIVNL